MKSASSQSSSPTTVLSVLSGHSAVTTTVPFCQPHSFLSDCQGTLEHSLESRSSQGKKQSHTSRFGQMPDSSVSSVHTGDASPLDCAENRGSHKKQETFSISNGDMFLAKKGMEHRDQIVTPTGSYPSGNVDALDTTWSHGLGKQTALVRKDFLTDFTSPVKVKRPRYSTCSNTEFVVDSSQEGSSNEKTDEAEPVETKASLDDSSQLPHTTGRWEISPKGMYNGHCQVCGDLAAGFYCGAFVCEACKKFFIRASKQEKQKFVCLHQGTCKITKESRVQCQYCRYQRCLELQMYYPGEGKRSVVRVGIAEIPCKVCGAPSSGFHFGALTCEGCKGFFRRMVKEREPGTYRCSAGGSCDISLHTRNMCKACRYQKCLNIGMSVEGSRIGRQPNAVKHAISLEVKKKCLQTGAEVRPSLRTSSLSGYASSVTATFHQSTPVSVSPPVPAPTVVHIKEETTSSPFSFTDVELMEVPASQLMCVKEEPEDDLDYQMLEDSLEAAAIELAHIPKKERSKSDIFDEQKFTLLSTTWKKMMEHFEFHAQCVIRFAKKVPDFRKLPIDDQVTLVQHSTYPIVILNHARGYELDTGYYNYFNFSKQEEEAVFEKAPLFKNLVVHFKHMGLMAQTMKMTDLEYTLLSCLLLLDSECQGLQSVKEVMAMQNRIIRLFEMYEERTCENGSSRFGEIMLRISELALANVQHTQIITTFVSGNPDLEVPKLFEEMFF